MKIYEFQDLGFGNFFYELNKSKIIWNDEINKQVISKLSADNIFQIATFFSDITRKVVPPKEKQLGVAIASESMSGTDYPCTSLTCRLSKLEQLKYVALTMCQTVFFKDPLQVFATDWVFSVDLEQLREHFYEELIILYSLKDLLIYSMVLPYQVNYDTCFDCLLRDIGGTPVSYYDVKKQIKHLYFDKTVITLELFEEGLEVRLTGPEQLYDHGEIGYTYPDIPESLAGKRYLTSSFEKGMSIQLRRTDFNKIDVLDKEIHQVMQQAITQLIYKSKSKCELIIDRPIEHEVIKMFYDKENLHKDSIYSKKVFDLLPKLPQIPLSELVKLRLNEQKSFQIHIANLQKLKGELLLNVNKLKGQRTNEAYEDIILPELNKLQAKIDGSLTNKTVDHLSNVAFLAGSVGFCYLSGVFEDPFKSIGSAAIFGGFTVAKDYIKEGMKSKDYEVEDFYYMLKLSKIKR